MGGVRRRLRPYRYYESVRLITGGAWVVTPPPASIVVASLNPRRVAKKLCPLVRVAEPFPPSPLTVKRSIPQLRRFREKGSKKTKTNHFFSSGGALIKRIFTDPVLFSHQKQTGKNSLKREFRFYCTFRAHNLYFS